MCLQTCQLLHSWGAEQPAAAHKAAYCVILVLVEKQHMDIPSVAAGLDFSLNFMGRSGIIPLTEKKVPQTHVSVIRASIQL